MSCFASYYAYEYSVFMRLNDVFKIESIDIDSETWEVIHPIKNEFGKLKNKVVKKFKGEDTIRLNFANDFHYEFYRKILREAYEQGYCEEYIVSQLRKDIQEEFLNKFVNR